MKKISVILFIVGLFAAISCNKDSTDPSTKIGAVTGDATHISCRNAAISGKANIPDAKATDLSFGVLYSTTSNVIIGSATQIVAKSFDSEYNYTINTEVLEPETTYYYRSYITQAGEITYGDVKSFKTLTLSSMIKTLDATDIKAKNAELNAMLDLTDCNYSVKEYGFELSSAGGSVQTIKSTNHSENKFSAKAESLTRGKEYSFVSYVILDGHTYKGETKSFTATPIPEGAVDMGLSVLWHKCNIGASKPEEYGRYFAWGDVDGQTWDGSKWSGDGFSTYPSYEIDEFNNLWPDYDAAYTILGGTWRMPTTAELQELIDNCNSTWTNDYEGTGIAGRIFTSKKEGYTKVSIFLPAAGYGDKSDVLCVSSEGCYWSCTFRADSYSWSIGLDSEKVGLGSSGRFYGFPIRPVSE